MRGARLCGALREAPLRPGTVFGGGPRQGCEDRIVVAGILARTFVVVAEDAVGEDAEAAGRVFEEDVVEAAWAAGRMRVFVCHSFEGVEGVRGAGVRVSGGEEGVGETGIGEGPVRRRAGAAVEVPGHDGRDVGAAVSEQFVDYAVYAKWRGKLVMG